MTEIKEFNIKFEETNYIFKFIQDETGKWIKHCHKEDELIPWDDVPRKIHTRVWYFQSENKINKVEDILEKKEYLIWVNFGGEQGSPICEQGYYKICHGRTEEEAVIDWFMQNNFDLKSKEKYGDTWTNFGRPLSFIRLIESNGYDGWKTLKWV